MTRTRVRRVHVEDAVQVAPVEAAETAVAGFVGHAAEGPVDTPSTALFNLAEVERIYGSEGTLWHAARAFFGEGGHRLHLARAAAEDPTAYAAALDALGEVPEIATVAAPGVIAADDMRSRDVAAALIDHAAAFNRFAVIDPPRGATVGSVRTWRARFDARHAALYYPWIRTLDADGAPRTAPPSAFAAGIYARVDAARGVWKAPASESIAGATGLETALNLRQQDVLNADGINCIRAFPTRGILLWGARTISTEPEWKYIPVRRVVSFLERSIERSLQWVVFERNDAALWQRVQASIEAFLDGLWRSGAFPADRAKDGYFVRCDASTMTTDDLEDGRLVALVGIAPLRPAEFVTIRIAVRTARAEV